MSATASLPNMRQCNNLPQLNHQQTFIIHKHNREFIAITLKSTAGMTSPFNEERNEHEFMWSSDELTHDWDSPCQTHNPLISPP